MKGILLTYCILLSSVVFSQSIRFKTFDTKQVRTESESVYDKNTQPEKTSIYFNVPI